MGGTRSCQTLQARGPISRASCQQQHGSTERSAAGRRLYQAERFTKVLISDQINLDKRKGCPPACGSCMAAANASGSGLHDKQYAIPG